MTAAEVILWGTRVGAVAIDDAWPAAVFEWDPAFRGSGIELSPVMMPLGARRYTFPELPEAAFRGLPGMLADALPDRYGTALVDAWLAAQGRDAASFDVVERLCYVGTRGMGALEFRPAREIAPAGGDLHVAALVRLASEVLTERERFVADLRRAGRRADADADAMRAILSVGTSAGGARAKAVIAYNEQTGQVRSGQVDPGPGFTHWLLKFDGVSGSGDRGLTDPAGWGAIEYAYSLMAADAGIEMTECRLLEEGGRRHFMTRRFDRTEGGGKLHMQSLAGLCHFDYNAPGAHGYEQALAVVRELGCGIRAVEEGYRRMVFNVLARNQDDHVKNIAFLMGRDGAWRLSPAFDVVYAWAPGNRWLEAHQMTVNGKRDGFTADDLRAVARTAGLRRGRAEGIVQAVAGSVRRWTDFAAAAGVEDERAAAIGDAHRLALPRR